MANLIGTEHCLEHCHWHAKRVFGGNGVCDCSSHVDKRIIFSKYITEYVIESMCFQEIDE